MFGKSKLEGQDLRLQKRISCLECGAVGGGMVRLPETEGS